MKKINILLVILAYGGICTAQNADTQTVDRTTGEASAPWQAAAGRLSLGIKAGLNYNSLYGQDLGYVFAGDHARYQPGYHIGISLDDKITGHFWLKHALIFNRSRAGVTLGDSINAPYHTTLKLSYLELQPANLTFRIKGLQVYAGPYISALLGAAITRKDGQGQSFNDRRIYGTPGDNESTGKYLQKFDFGVHAGLEYRLSSGISLSAGYSLGLTDVFQYANSYTLNDTKNDNIRVYNQGFRLSMGYTFR